MAVKVKCTGCEKVLNAPDQARGKAIQCPSCKTKVVVPAGDEKPAKKGAKPAKAVANPDSESSLATLDLRNVEDHDARVCPKCGYDMSVLDEEATECPKCGYDVEAGGLGEKARKRQLKGPDPDKFYSSLWKSNWKFVIANQVLAWRTVLYLLIASTLMFACMFAYLYIAPWPPRAFFGLCTVICGLMLPGWLWFLDQQIVKATLERKDKLKRINLDFFLCSMLGVYFVAWHIVFAGPLLLIPGAAAWTGWKYGGAPMFVLPIVLGVCYLPVLSMMPIVIGHMVMPQQASGWMFWKVVPAWFKTLKPCFLWLMLLIFTSLPAIACVATAGAIYGQTLNDIAFRMDENTAIRRAKTLEENTSPKDKERANKKAAEEKRSPPFPDPLSTREFNKIDYLPLIVPVVLWLTACVLAGFPAMYLMRVNGQLIYFFRDHLDLQVLEKQYKYVAKEKKDEDEEEKPKTNQQVLVETLVGWIVFTVIGAVYGYVSASMNNGPIGYGVISGLMWGFELGFCISMSMLTRAAWDTHPAYGIVVGFTPSGTVIAIISFLFMVMFPPLRYVAMGFFAVAMIGLMGSLYFTIQHWTESRSGILLGSINLVSIIVMMALSLGGLFPTWVLTTNPGTSAPPAAAGQFDQGTAPEGVAPDGAAGGMPGGAGPAAAHGGGGAADSSSSSAPPM